MTTTPDRETPGQAYDRLTLRQYLFCAYYVQTLGNGAKAARLAGYSATSARYTARDLLKQEKIRRALAALITAPPTRAVDDQ